MCCIGISHALVGYRWLLSIMLELEERTGSSELRRNKPVPVCRIFIQVIPDIPVQSDQLLIYIQQRSVLCSFNFILDIRYELNLLAFLYFHYALQFCRRRLQNSFVFMIFLTVQARFHNHPTYCSDFAHQNNSVTRQQTARYESRQQKNDVLELKRGLLYVHLSRSTFPNRTAVWHYPSSLNLYGKYAYKSPTAWANTGIYHFPEDR